MMTRGIEMKKLTAFGGVLVLLCMQAAHADRTAKFPDELSFSGINEGYATVAWTVAPDGRIEDTIVLEASHAAFGRSALEALPKRLPWKPGAVLPRYESAKFLFKRVGAVNSFPSAAEMVWEKQAELRRGEPTMTIAATDLSHPLLQTSEQASVCPKKQEILAGAATVRFVIDSDGKVRVPRIVDASSSDFALAMLSAVKQWQFAPPSYAGEPVQVEDTQAFIVSPTDACVVFKPQAQQQMAGR
jgi:TonB family protein